MAFWVCRLANVSQWVYNKTKVYFDLESKYSKAMVFPVVIYGCENWMIKKAEHWRIDSFELWCWRSLLRIPWTVRRSNKSILKEINCWVFFGRTDIEIEAPILWPPDTKSQLIGEDPDAGKDWGQEEKWVTEDKMVGWHHWLNGHEFEQIPGDGEGQASLASCSPGMMQGWTIKQQCEEGVWFWGNCLGNSNYRGKKTEL